MKKYKVKRKVTQTFVTEFILGFDVDLTLEQCEKIYERDENYQVIGWHRLFDEDEEIEEVIGFKLLE